MQCCTKIVSIVICIKMPAITEYWSKTLKLSINRLEKMYFKNGVSTSFRKNKEDTYFVQVCVKVMRSTDLNRKISGWIKGMCK